MGERERKGGGKIGGGGQRKNRGGREWDWGDKKAAFEDALPGADCDI